MTRRSYVRITSYIIFILTIIIAFAILNTRSMKSYKNQLELSYQQSLTELSECLDSVNTDLTKSLYSNSANEIYDVSRDLYAQCSTAKNAISRLPVSQMELGNTYKFLSQASDYAQYIGGKIENGDNITEEEHQNIYKLLDYAQKFSDAADEMVRIVENGARITEGEVSNNSEIQVKSLSNSFSVSAKTFESFPTLLYDGPFSDQILNKSSQLVKSSDVKTKDECKKIAADCLDVSTNKVSFEADEQSILPCYTYTCGRYSVSVTKQGGYIKSILYSGIINDAGITEENAINIAKDFLKKIGYSNMEECYYNTSNNVCTVNFAYTENNVFCYSDLIKCGISLSDGSVVSLDAKTYLTNHIDRAQFSPKLSAAECQKNLSQYLTAHSIKQCVIPKENGTEIQCYEFLCTSKDTGEDTLVYINCNTGEEEDIMLLLYTDNGTLVK
ncbi:MAG: PepSY1/2 domain-containing protein [Eubacterium sp.]